MQDLSITRRHAGKLLGRDPDWMPGLWRDAHGLYYREHESGNLRPLGPADLGFAICQECGLKFPPRDRVERTCPHCADERDDQLVRAALTEGGDHCRYCGDRFEPGFEGARYCSDDCRTRARESGEYEDEPIHTKEGNQEEAPEGGADKEETMESGERGTCTICGKQFPKVRENQIYCGEECRAKGRRQYNREDRARRRKHQGTRKLTMEPAPAVKVKRVEAPVPQGIGQHRITITVPSTTPPEKLHRIIGHLADEIGDHRAEIVVTLNTGGTFQAALPGLN